MKKKILSQLLILSFAFAGLFLVGNNVFGHGEQEVVYHTATYDCRDTNNYSDNSTWWYAIRARVCQAPGCAVKYVGRSITPAMATCTVYYNMP